MRALTRNALIVASLALSADTAMAATAHLQKAVWPDLDASSVSGAAAPQDRRPAGPFGFAYAGPGHGRVYASSSSPGYDSAAVIDNSGDQTAQQDAANTQMMLNSMQAAQEQNDEANAEFTAGILAAQQTEINANSYANNPNN